MWAATAGARVRSTYLPLLIAALLPPPHRSGRGVGRWWLFECPVAPGFSDLAILRVLCFVRGEKVGRSSRRGVTLPVSRKVGDFRSIRSSISLSRSPLRFFMLPLVVFASASPCCAFVSSMQSRKKVFSSVQSQKKVFCYGDSLTAGTSPPLPELFPYGPYLESELRRLVPDASPIVRWSGYPGWCATTMADPSTLDGSSGLRTFLRTISAKTGSPASLSVILAGTNDLAYESDSRPIVDAILALHRASHGEGVPTAAVGIPPSMWQRQSSDAANLAATVNKSLEGWCSSSEAGGMATFVECPIDISSVGDELWSSDGLHFSPAGFKALGEGLAPSIAKIIQ